MGSTGRLTSLKGFLAQNIFWFKISKASVLEAHTKVSGSGRINRSEQEKHDERLPRAYGEIRTRTVSKTRVPKQQH